MLLLSWFSLGIARLISLYNRQSSHRNCDMATPRTKQNKIRDYMKWQSHQAPRTYK